MEKEVSAIPFEKMKVNEYQVLDFDSYQFKVLKVKRDLFLVTYIKNGKRKSRVLNIEEINSLFIKID
jgi:hypothetical protein